MSPGGVVSTPEVSSQTTKEVHVEHDEYGIGELIEESRECHADAMRQGKAALEEIVELGRDEQRQSGPEEAAAFVQRRNSVLTSLPAVGVAAGLGAAIVALSSSAAFAASTTTVQILQTQESIENLAISTYDLALTLPFIGGSSANKVVKAFVTETVAQHRQHKEAFAAAISRLGGKAQNNPDPVLLKVVNAAKPKLTDAAAVVSLALELEDGAAQTYVANTAAITNASARNLTASIMGVEAQHAAILRAVGALLAGGAPQLIALPPKPLTALPAAAGSVGFPYGFYPTSAARPQKEGAL